MGHDGESGNKHVDYNVLLRSSDRHHPLTDTTLKTAQTAYIVPVLNASNMHGWIPRTHDGAVKHAWAMPDSTTARKMDQHIHSFLLIIHNPAHGHVMSANPERLDPTR